MIKQFVPEATCLKCQGCCRFKDANSVWSPCLLDDETINLIDKEGIPSVFLSIDRKLQLIPNPSGENFICPFFGSPDNKCKIYSMRPFECQLYPFLLTLRGKKALLTVDLNCPYIKDNLNTPEFKLYTDYLTEYLNSPAQVRMLKENPQILAAYEDVQDVVELERENDSK